MFIYLMHIYTSQVCTKYIIYLYENTFFILIYMQIMYAFKRSQNTNIYFKYALKITYYSNKNSFHVFKPCMFSCPKIC